MVCCIGLVGKIGIAVCELSTNQQVNSVVFKDNLADAAYGKFVSLPSKDEHVRRSSDTVAAILNKTSQVRSRCRSHPCPEQPTIAAYLNRKTDQIDTLIAKKHRLIDLLRAQAGLEMATKEVWWGDA